MKRNEKRDKLIKKMIKKAAALAKKYNYTEMVIEENREKGLWGENLTRHLEKKYGQCTKAIKWFKPGYGLTYGDNIEFRFMFSKPCICIDHRNVDGSLAEICLKEDEDTGEFSLAQFTIFQEQGIVFQKELLTWWNRVKKNINKEITTT